MKNQAQRHGGQGGKYQDRIRVRDEFKIERIIREGEGHRRDEEERR
jgi:hypothetical protein